ncbi:enoyl-CoA hydratase (plasmid) [Pseudonocardia sp. EC080610-09]|uniref:enoyl-CoA hydratase-related protein n=1 Tax=unclassified Pseudonocardia TaxID=2619320 RepID=UPI0007059910|nr:MULTISPECIES: enoyl-CoA hydratase-related protein [unclassified Pseudonocardia]ALL79360.1 enoyl-CoA hydratase [Pseudonocardia sp. EC080610-09]ALL85332.1 enoyl-CoA hydratase [Pseudonocardia sp. EC080619-01]
MSVVRTDCRDGVATVTLESPANRNALSARLRVALADALDDAIADPAVRAIVLTHTGPVFCAGMDLKESRGADAADQGVNGFPRILETLWTSPTPVIARLAGPARAGGVGLVAACDVAVAAEAATFAFSEVRIGVVPAVISVTALPRLQARAAHELFLTGETFDARRAAEIGLVNRAVPLADLDAEVERYTGMLRLGAPGALAGTKALLRRRRPESMTRDLAETAALSASYFAGREAQEGMRAFAEKRSPAWVTPAGSATTTGGSR